MFAVTTPISTERLQLRPFTLDDLDDFHAILSRPDVVRYLYWQVLERDEARAALERKVTATRLDRDDDVLRLAVVASPANAERARVIGEMSLWWRSVEHRQGEIGFVFHPDFQRQGFATEAALATLALAFDQLGLHRVYGRADARNAPSAAVMRRLGMRQEAHFISNEVFKGEWADEVVFAILEDEWAARQVRHSQTDGASPRVL